MRIQCISIYESYFDIASEHCEYDQELPQSQNQYIKPVIVNIRVVMKMKKEGPV